MVEKVDGSVKTEQFSIEQLKSISGNFTQELQNAKDGKQASLAFIVHGLSPSPIVKDGEIFETLVIGGTDAKVAIFKRNGKNNEILGEIKKTKFTPKNEEEFLSFICSSISEDVNALAVNLAHPLKPVFDNGILDGVLLDVSKEGKFRGLIGKQIGRELKDYVFAKRNKIVEVAVANDTVCLLTSGLTQFTEDKLAGGIVGTGFNLAFFLEKNKLINLESGGFNKFPQTSTGKIIDRESAQPGVDLLKKK